MGVGILKAYYIYKRGSMKKEKKLSTFQKRQAIFKSTSDNLLRLKENKLYIFRRTTFEYLGKVIDLDKSHLYYDLYAHSTDLWDGKGVIRGLRMRIAALQFHEIILWTKVYAPITASYVWMSDEYKKKAFST